MRYYFHLHNGIGLTCDKEGRELVDQAHAQKEAIVGIRSVIAAEVSEGRVDLRGYIEIADERGVVIETVHFLDAVEIMLPNKKSLASDPRLRINNPRGMEQYG